MKKSEKVVKFNPKKKVNVLERLMALGILPKEGSFTNLKLLRLVKESLSFNEAENKALQFRTEVNAEGAQMMIWNSTKLINKATGDLIGAPEQILQQILAKDPDKFEAKPACPDKEIFFGDVVEGLIRKSLKELDKAEKLTADHYSLYEKFMEGHEDEPDGETRH